MESSNVQKNQPLDNVEHVHTEDCQHDHHKPAQTEIDPKELETVRKYVESLTPEQKNKLTEHFMKQEEEKLSPKERLRRKIEQSNYNRMSKFGKKKLEEKIQNKKK